MQETIISFETAKLAKEKGFDIPVISFYTLHNNKPFITGAGGYNTERLEISNWNNGKGSYPTKPEEVECSAPTQSLLQKWLREEYQIIIDIQPDCTCEPKYCFKINRFIGNPIDLGEKEWSWYSHKQDNWALYYTYEKALEEGLIEALKLI